MPWIIAAVFIVLIFMAQRAKATVSGGNFDFRLQSLADAISTIEGGSALNPGNIRDSTGAVGKSGDLMGLLNRAFISQTSNYYSPDMTFRALAWTYVCGPRAWNNGDVKPELCDPRDKPENWAAFVAGRLGVSVDSTVWEYLNS